MSKEQCRKFAISTYLRPEELPQVFADKSKQIRAYAYCTHDKDDNETHTHVILWLSFPYPISTIRNWFRGCDLKGELANTLVEPCRDIVAMYRYLTHKDNPDKYQYPDDAVICSDPSCFEDDVQTDDTWTAVEDLINGVPLREVARRYGRDFIYHYSHIRQLVADIKAEE